MQTNVNYYKCLNNVYTLDEWVKNLIDMWVDLEENKNESILIPMEENIEEVSLPLTESAELNLVESKMDFPDFCQKIRPIYKHAQSRKIWIQKT